MANQKEYKIIINGITESIEGIGTLQDSLDRLGAKVEQQSSNIQQSSRSMDELAKAEQKIAEYNEEYQRALQADKAVLADKNKAIKESLDLEKANMTVQEGAQGTYAEKQQLLSALGKVIKNTNAETEEEIQKQNELKAQYAALNQELKDFDASLGNHQRNVGDYGQATNNLRQELREFQLEMANMLDNGVSKADPQFVELAKKAGALKDAMSDAGEEINRFASDTKGLDDVINIAQSATAAFELYNGAMSAFGIETEGAEEAMQKLMGAMSIIQSLQTLSETLQNGSATARLFNTAMKVTGTQLVQNQLASIKATAAQQGLSTVQKAGAIASKTLGLAMKSIPLMFIIGLVATLITHWEDIVSWFKKTFPVLDKMGGAFNILKGVIMGVGKAVVHWLVNPFETFAKVIKKILAKDFDGAVQEAINGLKKQFTGLGDAFNTEYKEQIDKGLDDIAKKNAAKQAEQTRYELDQLIARKGNQAKYSKEGIALQKKEFALRKKAAKGNAEELKQINLDELRFYRECEEAKAAAAKKSADEIARTNKAAAAEAKRIADEEAQRIADEEAKRKRINGKKNELSQANNSLEQELIRQKIKLQEEEVKKYEKGPIASYTEAANKLKDLKLELVNLNAKSSELNFIKDFKDFGLNLGQIKDILDATDKKFKDMVVSEEDMVNAFPDITKKLDKEGLIEFTTLVQKLITANSEFASQREEINKQTIEGINKTIEAEEKANTDFFIKVKDNTIAAIEKAIDGVENIDTSKMKSLWHRIFDKNEVKKQEEAFTESWKHLGEVLDDNLSNMMKYWQAYLDYLKIKYGEDSKEYIEEQKKMYEAWNKYHKLRKQADKNSGGTSSTSNMGAANGKGGKKQGQYVSDNGNTDFKKLFSLDPDNDSQDDFFPHEKIAEIANMLFENVFDPINEAFSAMLEFQIEEAEEALDKATEMHDKSVDQLEESQNKVKELNDKMKNSSGAQLEALKQQQADEMLLLAQREAEEKRLAREKEKREKELAKKEKQQRKQELKMQLIEGIANTAVSVTKALTWGWPLGAIFAGIIGAMGAMQTAIIRKQMSKLADGGLLQGRSHAQGGIPVGNTGIEVEGGEYVINKRSTAKYLPLLQAINEEGARKKTVANQLGKYANGGQLNYQRISSNLDSVDTNKVIQNSIDQIDMHPQVSVVDINRGQKNLTQVRQMAGASR